MKRKTLIFDLDGTLYKFKGSSFASSTLYKEVLKNALDYISLRLNKSKNESRQILNKIKKNYGENISIALEKEYGLDRYDYFNYVWNINPKRHIIKYKGLPSLLDNLKKDFNFLLLTDAPRPWIKNLLKELRIEKYFNNQNIFSGEGDKRKIFGNRLKEILKQYKINPSLTIVFGDQESTDIIPAKKLGCKTVFVNSNRISQVADYNIKNILDVKNILGSLRSEKEDKFLKVICEIFNLQDCNNLKILNGSTSSFVFVIGGNLYKIGLSKDLDREIKAYQIFKDLLGKKYYNIFPDFVLLKKIKNLSLYKFKYLGRYNLEEYLFNFYFKNRNKELLLKINGSVLKNLDCIYKITQKDDPLAAEQFFFELLKAIKVNLNKAGLFNEKNKKFIKNIKLNKKIFVDNCLVSLAHKDLSAGNIIIHKNKTYFVDPRISLPHLTDSKAPGNIGIDLIGYYVTIIRKELELKRKGKYSLYFIKTEINKKIREYIKNRAFNRHFVDLCFLYWYSVYLGCNCGYCTSPERKWLYIKMKKEFYFYKKRIKSTLKI